MLQKIQTLCDPILRFGIAVFLGYGLFHELLRGLIPDAWAMPGTLISAVPLFLVLRWLGESDPRYGVRPTDFEDYEVDFAPARVSPTALLQTLKAESGKTTIPANRDYQNGCERRGERNRRPNPSGFEVPAVDGRLTCSHAHHSS